MRNLLASALSCAACVAVLSATADVPRAGAGGSTKPAVAAVAARPLAFERNDGQTDARVRFVARGAATVSFVTDDGLTIAPHGGRAPLCMTFDGAAAHSVHGDQRLPGVVHYLRGNDRSRWRTDVPLYARAVASDVWPGIDVVFHGGAREMEYDFDVAPGADAAAIALAFGDGVALAIDATGGLVVETRDGTFRHRRPRVFEDGREVAGAFALRGDGRVRFDVPDRDPSRRLVIDPVIAYATYLGGSDSETAFDMAVDAEGNAYLTGAVASVDFPTANALPGAPGAGSGDAFITKLSPSGAKFLHSTFFGGGGADIGWGIRASSKGIYVAGSTTSSDFPAIGALQPTFRGGVPDGDAFLVLLAPSGADVTFSTFLGGSGNDACRGLDIDAAGNSYLGGFTTSADFPTTPGAAQRTRSGTADAWAAKIDASGTTVRWATYLGGTIAPDVIEDVAVGPAGSLFVTGFTASTDFPYLAGFQRFHGGGSFDGFVARLDAQGALAASTFLGGLGDDSCRRVATDAQGHPHVAGFTLARNFPTKNAAQTQLSGGLGTGDGFVTAFDPLLATLDFSTYLGGSDDDDVHGLAVAPDGAVFVTGNTTSSDFPSLSPLQPARGGGRDAFATKLAPGTHAVAWSTYYGGAGYDAGTALAVDAFGDAYLALAVGGAGLPTLCAAQPTFAGGDQDCYAVKITDVPSQTPATPLAPQATAVSPYRIDLVWTDASRNECSFRVERKVGGGEFSVLATPDTNAASLTDLDVLPDRTYAYRVVAVNPFGESPPSAEAAVTTPQTLVLGQRNGSLKESNAPRGDRIRVHTIFRFNVLSADHDMHPLDEDIDVVVGAETDPVTLHVPAHDPRWRRGRGRVFTWTSPRSMRPAARIVIDLSAPSLTVSLSRLDFPTTPNGSIFLSLRAGDDAGHISRTWTAKKRRPGVFKLP